jgi:hypothetical protein
MSLNLLQSSFRMSRRKGVRLEFTLHEDGVCYKPSLDPLVPCSICGKAHQQIWVAWRKPAGFWGAWTVFRYLGGEHTPDLSVPIAVPRPPKNAVRLGPTENSRTWHR